ncbi:hypothetical protein SAY87_025940 [Trapa incisa]|uniref:Serine/arginine-rich splicing factor RS2Z32-like n=2 Tax=Trapa TaxID=22665 RepID=A0AAN7JKS4_9MYRT|nr:hypothetical protein SAY87_025940 [Trapa incisa]
MPRYDDRHSSSTRLYVGHLSPRIRSRDLEDIFSRYGRIRDVDMKRDYAFVEFSDPRDADDAQYNLNGREIRGSRIVVEFSKGVPRGSGSSRELGRGPPPGSGRCFNCGIDGHWARDCKAGDWKNRCYRCGDRGHIERNCPNSPKKLSRGRSYSRSPTPRRYRSRSRSYSRSRSRSMSPAKRDRNNDDGGRKMRSPRYSRSPERERSPSPLRGRKRSPTPEDRSPHDRDDRSPKDRKYVNGSDYSGSPRERSKSPVDAPEEEGRRGYSRSRSPAEENGRSYSPAQKDDDSPGENVNHDSPRGSE